MRPYIISLLLLFSLLSTLVIAVSHQSGAANEATRIEVDEEANVIHFFIDGEETMRLDARGLHVRDDLTYGGVVVDVGKAGYPGTGYAGGTDAE